MRKGTPVQYVIRLLFYILGLFCLAMGVAVSINSDLGVSPVNSLPYIISQISGFALSSCVTGIFCFYILLQFIILRRNFNPINCLQIAFSFIFGYFTGFTKALIGTWAIPTYPGRLLMLAISIVFIALGVVFYVDAELVPMPMEGLSLTLAKLTNTPFPTMKTIVDCVVVATGIVLSFLFLHGLFGIREGTVVTALTVGKLVAILRKPIRPIMNRLCFGEKA